MLVMSEEMRFNHRPFVGRGASLYAGIGPTGDSIKFRRLRVMGCDFVIGSTFSLPAFLRKCTFIAQVNDPTNTFTYPRPPEWLNQTVWVQVRPFWNGVELPSNYDPIRLDFTTEGAIDPELHCTGEILTAAKRDGGVYRLTTIFTPASHGVQPTSLLIRKTAGPGTLADVSTSILIRARSYKFDTAGLTDGQSYTFALIATDGTTELQLDTITFTADAAGPPAATALSLTEY